MDFPATPIRIHVSLGRVCRRPSGRAPATITTGARATFTTAAGASSAGTRRSTACAANRGLPTDYDGWAEKGAAGWGWNDVLPYFRKLENDLDFDGPLHGKEGPITMRRWYKDQWPPLTSALMQSIADAGWKDIKDQNGLGTDGFFPIVVNNTRDGQRMSAARGYLTKDVRARRNLTILGEAHAERLMFEGKRVVGVIAHRRGERLEFRSRETIVSMGAIHSPVFLLRNGIGPADELRALGIEVVHERAGVGKNMNEHPGVNLGMFLKPASRLPPTLRRPILAGLRFSSGIEGCPPGDMYINSQDRSAWHAIGKRIGIIMMWVNRSFSTGEIKLKSANPMVGPRHRFQHVFRSARHAAPDLRNPNAHQAAGASRDTCGLRRNLSGQLFRQGAQTRDPQSLERYPDQGGRGADGRCAIRPQGDHQIYDRRRAEHGGSR